MPSSRYDTPANPPAQRGSDTTVDVRFSQTAVASIPQFDIGSGEPAAFTKDLTNESVFFSCQPGEAESSTSLPDSGIDTRVQIELFEAKHALSVGKRHKRERKEFTLDAVRTVKTETQSEFAQAPPTDMPLVTEEELHNEFKRNNPDIEGEIKLTGVYLPGLVQYSLLKLKKTKCISISMPSFGLYNKVLLLVFNDDTTVLARIPFHATRAKMLSMKSEVATMAYIRLNRPLIPVAQVFSYEANIENAAKVPFMLIENMPGEHIYAHTLYDSDSSKAEKVLVNIAKVQAELAKPLPFNMIGNLFFKQDLPLGGSGQIQDASETQGSTWRGETENLILEATESNADREFEVGPLVFENQFDSDAIISGGAGPFKSLKDLFFFLIQHQRTCGQKVWRDILKETDALPPPDVWSPSRGTVTDFTKRCLQLCAIVHTLNVPDEFSGLCFYHWDLRMGNILIDRSTLEITAVLDWDDVRIVPMLLSATHPEEIREVFCWNEPTKYILPRDNNSTAENQSVSRWWWREHHRYNMCIFDERFALGGGRIWEEAEIAHRLYQLLFSEYNAWLEAYWAD